MKIVITSYTYEPYKNGVQAVNKYLAETLVARGNEVLLITQTHEKAPNSETKNGVRIIRLPIFNIHTIYKGDKKAYQQIVIRETKNADALINVGAETPWTDWCYNILDTIKCKKILYLHGMFDFKFHKTDFLSFASFGHKCWNEIRWLTHYMFLKSQIAKYDYVTHLHKDDDAFVFYKKYYSNEGFVIENAAEPEFFAPIDKKIEIEVPHKYGVFVGNYIPRKNQEFALKALYESSCPNDFGLVFIGSSKTKYYNKLINLNNKLASIYGRRDVKFLTGVSREQVREYVKRATVCVVGSTWEAYPVAVVECMAAGVPYISTDVGCVSFLPGGVIVKNSYEMGRWIEILSSIPNVGLSLGNAGREYALNNLTIEVCVNRLLNLIK